MVYGTLCRDYNLPLKSTPESTTSLRHIYQGKPYARIDINSNTIFIVLAYMQK